MIAGAKADDKCAGPPGEAEHSGPHPRAQQALLQHCHQLQEGQCLSPAPLSTGTGTGTGQCLSSRRVRMCNFAEFE